MVKFKESILFYHQVNINSLDLQYLGLIFRLKPLIMDFIESNLMQSSIKFLDFNLRGASFWELKNLQLISKVNHRNQLATNLILIIIIILFFMIFTVNYYFFNQ
jgi:hypothetical protein